MEKSAVGYAVEAPVEREYVVFWRFCLPKTPRLS
jgi:hypothetical protein